MSDLSARLSLPLIAPAQAQKHVTHNEALAMLDALVQAGAIRFDLSDPPALISNGDVYVVGPSPTGDWTGQAQNVALVQNGGWLFLQSQPGWRIWDAQTTRMMVYDGTAWQPLMGSVDNISGLGVNAAWDVTNRLSVASDASLFSHDGAGHQIKVNKATDADTASLLFQSNWTGHAEMGLAGDTSFSVKVSPDGSAWAEALRIDPVTLTVSGGIVQQSPDDTTPGRLMRADWGYSAGNLIGAVGMSSGVPTGAVIERGENTDGSFIKFADGTLICQAELAIDVETTAVQTFNFPHPFNPSDRPAIATSFSHMSGAPNSALSYANFRALGHTSGSWFINLLNAGTSSDPTSTTERMTAMAIGRWV